MRRSSSDLRFSQGGMATTLLRARSGFRSRLMYSTALCCSSTSMNLPACQIKLYLLTLQRMYGSIAMAAALLSNTPDLCSRLLYIHGCKGTAAALLCATPDFCARLWQRIRCTISWQTRLSVIWEAHPVKVRWAGSKPDMHDRSHGVVLP